MRSPSHRRCNTQKQVDNAINILKEGKAGGSQHALKNDLKGKWAIDVKGSGNRRGALRVIYEIGEKNTIIIHDITDYH